MNFVGVLTANEQGQIISTGVHGDVGILGDKEYVFVATNPSVSKTDGTWHELGDISAQSEGIAALQDRAKALEDTVNGTGDLSNGLVKKVAALETADSTQDGIITDQEIESQLQKIKLIMLILDQQNPFLSQCGRYFIKNQ